MIQKKGKLFDFRSSRVRREVKRGLGMNLGSGSGPREIWSQSAISAKRAKRMKRLKSFSCPQLLISSGKKVPFIKTNKNTSSLSIKIELLSE